LPACIAPQALQHLERKRAVDHVVLDEQHREVIEHRFVLRREHRGSGAHLLEWSGLQRFVQRAAQHALAHRLRETTHRGELICERGLQIVGHRTHHDRRDLLPLGVAAHA
jgi:hypothetical protein